MKTAPRLLLAICCWFGAIAAAGDLGFVTRSRQPTEKGLLVKLEEVKFPAERTACILCDFWDSHTCANAARRVDELAPRMAEVVAAARAAGVFVIHAPSDCMATYVGHPARKRAQDAPRAATLPEGIGAWQYWLSPEEEKAGLPVDASDGGNDDTPEEAAAWKEQLRREGRPSQKWPWRAQHAKVGIDPERDAISDRGEEIWNLLEARGLSHVVLAGVHANMCVCGRSFGLRQLARLGKKVVLLRDLTDAMYNPAMPPRVTHFRGTEMVVAHIERWICPTALSSDVFGGKAFRFAGDTRPVAAVMIGEDEYFTGETLPAFVEAEVARDLRPEWILEPQAGSGRFAGWEALDGARVLMVSVRRRALPAEQLDRVRRFVADGGAVVGIRTASHAFALRKGQPLPEGTAVWPEWDGDVLGGNYQNHHGAGAKTTASLAPGASHPVVEGLPASEFATGGSLYRNTPLRDGSTVLLTGRAEGVPAPEPVAWVRGGRNRVFYTSLGHPDDFSAPPFRRLLLNGLRWCAEP